MLDCAKFILWDAATDSLVSIASFDRSVANAALELQPVPVSSE